MRYFWHGWSVVAVALLIGIVLAAIAAVGWAGYRLRRGVPLRDAVAEALMLAGTAPWLGPLLVPNPHKTAARQLYLVPFVDLADQVSRGPRFLTIQLGGNLAVFAVLGFLMPIRYRVGLLAVAGVAAGCSTAIEVAQYVFALHRVSSIDDVLVNTAGGVLGALLSHRWWRRRAPAPAAPVLARSRQVNGERV
ncbi:MAG TPA: VanZ family protein [Rugosimonospora sp.]|nr:VanZ family protein [Rugosimonospora sp.]